ncbi:hypothetical protein, partial [Chromobacterium violaceum]|uniref:hypothetical protein n=1 Tax=Chromobacterium violaceum TaxID=536 RepID=UPI0009F00FD2
GALLLGGKFEIGEGHLLSHGSVLSQAGVEVVYGKVGDLFRPSLKEYADALVGWNGDAIIDAINGKDTWENPDGGACAPVPLKRHPC